ncbi:MAG: hypothetical protein RLZZ244_416 [Verrucomicrobiota bacterium]|jgi:starch synthase
MTILFAASEVAPFASTGGLGDVMASLPTYLGYLGHEVAVALPGYPALLHEAEPLGVEFDIPLGNETLRAEVYERLSPEGTQWMLIRNEALFERDGIYGDSQGPFADNASRFIFFSKAVVELARRLQPSPHILHLHDWHTALVPVLIRDQKLPLKTLLTLHNVEHQGAFWSLDFPLTNLSSRWFSPEGLEFFGQINLLKAGILSADAVTTVGKLYRESILHTPEGRGLQPALLHRQADLHFVPNGVDESLWDPASTTEIPAPFSATDLRGKATCREALLQEVGLAPAPSGPVFAMISRLAEQKGFDLLLPLLPRLLAADCRLVILGDGDPALRRDLLIASRQHPERFAFLNRWEAPLAKRILAGADYLVAPSHSEPCGLTPLHALRYGTIPIAHAVGGLQENLTSFDPTTRQGDALLYGPDSSEALWDTLQRALAIFSQKNHHRVLISNAMRASFSWAGPASQYDSIYRRICGAA